MVAQDEQGEQDLRPRLIRWWEDEIVKPLQEALTAFDQHLRERQKKMLAVQLRNESLDTNQGPMFPFNVEKAVILASKERVAAMNAYIDLRHSWLSDPENGQKTTPILARQSLQLLRNIFDVQSQAFYNSTAGTGTRSTSFSSSPSTAGRGEERTSHDDPSTSFEKAIAFHAATDSFTMRNVREMRLLRSDFLFNAEADRRRANWKLTGSRNVFAPNFDGNHSVLRLWHSDKGAAFLGHEQEALLQDTDVYRVDPFEGGVLPPLEIEDSGYARNYNYGSIPTLEVNSSTQLSFDDVQVLMKSPDSPLHAYATIKAWRNPSDLRSSLSVLLPVLPLVLCLVCALL